MNLENALQLLEESNGSHLYEIFIPSIGKDIKFKPITTGQQKTISKFSVGVKSFSLKYEMLKLSLFDELKHDDDDITSSELTEIDIIAFFAGVRLNNISEPLEIKFTCGECNTSFDYKIDLEKIIERCSKYNHLEFDFAFDVNGNKYELAIADPSYRNLIELEEYVEQMRISMDYNDDDITELRAFTKPCLYIKTVKYNGSDIDGFSRAGFVDKLKLYNSLPPKITFNGAKSILSLILDEFDLEASTNMMGEIKCTNPLCLNKLEGVLTNDSFFII